MDTNENPADLGTKVVPGGGKRNHLMENFYMIYVTMNEWLTPLCFSKMGLPGFPSRGKGEYSQPTPHQ